MTTPPPSLRVFATGATGSGKTTLLRRLYVERTARVLIVDFLGSDWPQLPGAHVVGGLDELADALGKVAGAKRWRIVAGLAPDDMPALAAWLLPQSLADGASFPRAVGGMALVCDEADLIAGPNADPRVLDLSRRGRHVGLSLYYASQRPAQVARLVTASSEHLLLCKQHEPRDLAYLRGLAPGAVVDELARLPDHGAIFWATREGQGHVLQSVGTFPRQSYRVITMIS